MRGPLSDEELAVALERVSELGRREDYDAMNQQVDAVVAACADARQLWALAETDPFWESAFGEEGPTPGMVSGVVARARSFADPHDVALALALATRMLAVHPGMNVLDDETVGRKDLLAAVAPELLAFARERVDASDRGVRIAAAHALGCCSGVDASDHARLSALLRDADESVAATARLSLAAVGARIGEPGERARTVEPIAGDDPSRLVGCARAGYRARVEGRLDREHVEALARAIDEPEPLPPEWGWRWEPGRPAETTAHLATKIATRAEVAPAARPRLIDALVRWAERERALAYLQDDLLIALAFGDAADAPALGYTVDELTLEQRATLRALALGTEGSLLVRFGFDRVDIPALLAGEGGLWRPLDVQSPAGPRRWDLVRLWRERIFDRIDEDEAARAILDGLGPTAALEAICAARRGVLLMLSSRPASLRSEDEELRDTALVFRVARTFVARGLDGRAAVRAMIDAGGSWDWTTLGRVLACVHETPGAPPRDVDTRYLAWASRFSCSRSPVHAAIAGLDAAVRERVESQARALGVVRSRP